MLSTFQLVNANTIISPLLITTRDYGVWLEDVFGEYIAKQELYMKSTKTDGRNVLEWHPGTRIGKWFDTNKNTARCWYIMKDSPILDRLDKYGLLQAQKPQSIPGNKDVKALRLYTAEQIELYIKTCIDKTFNIASYISEPKQIKVRDTEMLDVIIPKTSKKRTLI